MGWLFGCLPGRRKKSSSSTPHKNQFLSNARKALQKVSSRRDKAQVLPDTSPENHKNKPGDYKKLEDDAKAREEAHQYVTRELKRLFSSPSNAETRPTSREQEDGGGVNETAGKSLDYQASKKVNPGNLPAPQARRSKSNSFSREYLSIDGVFPESLFDHPRCCEASPGTSGNSDEQSFCVSSERKSQLSFDDKPILGLVPAEYPEPESEVKSSKSWDGNGIPNSTSKYKEDQMVSFQTLSFEARLERALASHS